MDLRFRQHRIPRQLGVDIGDAVGDQAIHLVLRGEIRVPGVGNAPLVGPPAHGRRVDVDQRADHVAPVAEADGFLDVRNEFEPVLDQLGRVGGAVLQGADILHPVDDPQMAVIAEIAGVPGVKPSVGIPGLRGGGRIAVILPEHAGRAHEDFALRGEFEFDAIGRRPHRVRLDLSVALHGHEEAGLRRAVELFQVHAEGTEEGHQIRCDGVAGGESDADLAHPQHVPQRTVDQDLAQRG